MMKLKELKMGELVAKIPVVQGGMGVGISLSGLAGAVAREGGVGIISAAQVGYNFEGFAENPLKANLESLAYHIKKAKETALGGVVGVNIMCVLNHYAEYVKCCIENKADLIVSGAGLPTNLPELVKNSTMKIAPIVSSVKAADVLLKIWDKKYGKTADMIVVEGPKAGGHLGFSLEDLQSEMDFDENVKNIIKHISEYEDKYNREIPTVFAGGVYDREDAEHYLELGCAGVQIATRFVATEECDAHENFKLAYVGAEKDDVTIVKSPVGLPGRAFKNEFIRKVLSGNCGIGKCGACIKSCNPKTAPYCITKALINSASGKMSDGLVFCGESVSKIKEITTVKKIMSEFV